MSHPLRTLRWAGALASATLALVTTPVSAQVGGAGLIGRLFDERTGEAIPQAAIFVDSVYQDVPVSSQGRFVLSRLMTGRHRLELRVIGYRPQAVELTFAEGQVLERQFPMVFTGERLPDIAVEARNSKLLTRFADFEKRRQHGLGTYITRDEIKAHGYMNMGDALRTVTGVRVNCGAVDCSVHMTRSTAGCFPTFYVDGLVARSFAASTPISDVQGIEIYRGAGEMPGEFGGSGSMCGVVVIWTRAAP
jgi:CarboxypepD_reg-like domain/TonB-dependent Receptor Plug Domain